MLHLLCPSSSNASNLFFTATEYVAEIFTEEVVDLKPCIPETEILDAIKQLPKGKAVGEDNVPD